MKDEVDRVISKYDKADLILLGDGSGLKEEGAWAVVLIDNIADSRTLFTGCVSHTTVNIMELLGYLHVLNYCVKREFHKRNPWKPKVIIITDSLITKKCGDENWDPKSNLPFWKMLETLKDKFDIEFKHIERNSNPISKFCDKTAGQLRKFLIGKQRSQFVKDFDKLLEEESDESE